MTTDRDYTGDMTRIRIDGTTADRLLSGTMLPEDAPPQLAGVAGLLHTAAGPASASELAHEAAVVGMASAAVSCCPARQGVTSRRKTVLSKLLTAKVAALATIAAFGLGTAAAAAAGSLPGQTSHASKHAAKGLATAQAHVSSSTSHSTSHSTSATNPSKTTTGSIPSTGPANVHAQFGLCTAFLASNTSTQTSTPPQDSSTAFAALIKEHGGTPASTVSYCKSIAHPGSGSSSDEPSGTGKPSNTGKPSGAGKPSNTGKPSGAGSAGHAPVSTPSSGGAGGAGNAASD